MNLTRDEKIRRWSNHTTRNQFLTTYKEWDEWVRVDELSLIFHKYELSDSKWIVAMEYQCVYSSYYGTNSARSEKVKYFVHNPLIPFQPNPVQEFTINEMLKDEKVRLQAEKRAERNKK